MMEQVLAAENLQRAWRRVKANAGAPGIDGMTVEAFPAFACQHWPRIRFALMSGTYRPAPVRRVFIPKPDGSQRPLGVPTVLDRLIQQALAQVLTPLFDGGFSTRSYGFREGRLKLVVNRAKSKAAPLRQCAFLGFQIGSRGLAVWTVKAHARFTQRVREITRRNRGHRVQDVIDELRRYDTGWLNYFGISHTYNQVVELAEWVRRRVRLYYWKQWKRPRTRRRHLLALGTDPAQVHMATRSRKGYWRRVATASSNVP